MKRIVVLIFALVALAVIISGCGKKQQTSANRASEAAKESGVPVKVTKVSQGTIAQTLAVTGSLTALRDVQLAAKSLGRIQAVFVNEGDVVRVGQIVVQQDASDLLVQLNSVNAQLQSAHALYAQAQSGISAAKSALAQAKTMAATQPEQTSAAISSANAQLSQAKSNITAAKSNRDRALADYKRFQSLASSGAISQQQLDSSKSGYDTAESQLSAAKQQVIVAEQGVRAAKAASSQVDISKERVTAAQAGLEQARAQSGVAQAAIKGAQSQIDNLNKQISNLSVRSSISGVVAQKTAQPGQTGAPGAPLLRIVDLGSIVFEGRVDEAQLSYFRQGQPVSIKVEAFPNEMFAGTVSKIYPAGDPNSRDFKVQFSVNNSSRRLRPGMFARGEVIIKQYRNVSLVPKDAIVQVGEKTWLYTIDSGKAKKLPVSVQVTDQRSAMVIGASVGQQVVIQGQNDLQDNTAVRIQPD